MEMSASEPVQDDEEEDIEKAVPENKVTLDNLAEGFQLFETDFDLFYNMDPSMIQALKLKQMMEEELVLYRNIFREMKKQKSQTEITMYFHKVTLHVPASSASPSSPPPLLPLPPPRQQDQASSSSASSAHSM